MTHGMSSNAHIIDSLRAADRPEQELPYCRSKINWDQSLPLFTGKADPSGREATDSDKIECCCKFDQSCLQQKSLINRKAICDRLAFCQAVTTSTCCTPCLSLIGATRFELATS